MPKSNLRLSTLISRSLSLPRRYTSAMRASIREAPRKALRYDVYRDSLVSAMMKAYGIGYRVDGSTLHNDQRDKKQAEYYTKARKILIEYQVWGNKELKRAYDKSIKAGKTHKQATKIVLRRFRALGMDAPATNQMESLFRTALNASYQQGIWDASQNNQAVKGFKYKTREDSRVRHPWHTQLNNMTAPKDSPIWDAYFPPWQFGCRCYVQPLKRVPKKGWTGLPSGFKVPPDDGFDKSAFELI